MTDFREVEIGRKVLDEAPALAREMAKYGFQTYFEYRPFHKKVELTVYYIFAGRKMRGDSECGEGEELRDKFWEAVYSALEGFAGQLVKDMRYRQEKQHSSDDWGPYSKYLDHLEFNGL